MGLFVSAGVQREQAASHNAPLPELELLPWHRAGHTSPGWVGWLVSVLEARAILNHISDSREAEW